ncbi:MAG TPA: SDR family NAD(P)-dependent oxidoreductase [Vicinamibacterales bacterium]|nr:SDR family NAD(P)-dependent oxidoreductase [Vicinamibacterales bacterium]
MTALAGQVAVVAGATRGAGRGIARMLGEAGATVYCTGRSSRTAPRAHAHHYRDRPETIEETAELVTAAGGAGIPIVVDHADEAQVKALFARVGEHHGRLDILVNVLTHAPVADWSPFWQQDVQEGHLLVDGWLWPHVITARHALPLMIAGRSGLLVEIIEQEGIGYHGQVWFDLFHTALKRLAYAVAVEGADHGITAISLTPGFMRTEAILEQFGATEGTWKEVAVTNAEAKRWGLIASETPCYVGRAIAALAADPARARFSGGVYSSATLSEVYDFTDLDGSRPNMQRYLTQHHPELFVHKSGVARWDVTSPVPRAGSPQPQA